MGRRARIAVGAIAVLYVVTRLGLLWRFPPFWDESFYGVEGQTAFDDAAQRFAALTDGKGPLLDWSSALLIGQGFHPLTAVRTVSFLAGLVTLSAVGLIGRLLGGITVGLAAAALYVLLPLFLVHDSLGVVDPLVSAAAAVALYLQLRLARRPTGLTAVGLGVALAAGILAKQTGNFALLLLPLSLVCFDWRGADRGRRMLRWAGCVALALLIVVAGNGVLRLSPLYDRLDQTRAALHQFRPIGQALKHPFTELGGNLPGFSGVLTGYVTLPLVVAVIVGAVLALRAGRRPAVVLLAWGVVPFAAALVLVEYGYARYVLSAIPPLVVLAAYAVVEGARRVRLRWPAPRARLVGVAALLVVLLPALVQDGSILADPSTASYPGEDDWQFVAGWPAGTGVRGIAEALDRRAAPGATTTVAYVLLPPWSLAAELEHPHRVTTGSLAYVDDFVARAPGGRTFRFVKFGTPAAQTAQFVYQHDTFGLPAGTSLAGYRVVAAFRRPHGGKVKGKQQPPTTVQLYERG
jgi:4-amino-4-deoxy-L-arabinose transferase-like glycosyltransferase